MLLPPLYYHKDILCGSGNALCQMLPAVLQLSGLFILTVRMEQANIPQVSFHTLECFFYKFRRFMFTCTISYDFQVIKANKNTYVIPMRSYPYIRQIAYHNIPVSLSVKLPVQDIFRFWFVTGVFPWFILCSCVCGWLWNFQWFQRKALSHSSSAFPHSNKCFDLPARRGTLLIQSICGHSPWSHLLSS